MKNLTYTEFLRNELKKSKYPNDFIEKCCQYSDNLLLKNLPVLFDAENIDMVLKIEGFYKDPSNSYHTFNISNNEKTRIITAPSKILKRRQRWILDNILSQLPISNFSYGFEKGNSIKKNALVHAENNYVICMDIENFFPSIKQEKITAIFRNAGYTMSAAKRLSDLCCYNGALPQGAPTSPRLANIVCKELDVELNKLSGKFNAIYSRYADDLTFSSKYEIGNMISEVSKIVNSYGFHLNSEKTSIYLENQPKFITGLVVQNGSVRVPKAFKRKLKQEIYYCERFGVLNHLQNSDAKKYINYREYLYGKAYYVHMIEEDIGNIFLKKLDEIEWPVWSL